VSYTTLDKLSSFLFLIFAFLLNCKDSEFREFFLLKLWLDFHETWGLGTHYGPEKGWLNLGKL